MAFNWDAFSKYFGQGISDFGRDVGTSLTAERERKRKEPLETAALTQTEAENRRLMQDEADRKAAMDAIAKWKDFAATKSLNDINMLPTSQAKLQKADELGLTASPYAKDFSERLEKRVIEESKLQKSDTGGFGGWQLRIKEWDDINNMPNGEEKQNAKNSFLYKWAPGTAYAASPESIEQAFKRARAISFAGTTAKIGAETAAGGGVNPIINERATKMREEFTTLPEIKTVKNLYQNYDRSNNVYRKYMAGKATPYEVDQSLGYFTSKALDPNSVVMPTEFDRFAKGLGIAEGAMAMAQKLIDGGLKLTDAQRSAMLNIINNSFDSAQYAAKKQYDYYGKLATKRGVDIDDVVGSAGYIFENVESKQETISEKDREAIEWAKSNPNDPRSKKILSLHGM